MEVAKKIRSTGVEYLIMTFGSIIMAAGVYFFKIPNGFSTGGVSGIGTILGRLTSVSPATWITGLNMFLLLLGFAVLGKETGIRTVYCSVLFSGFTSLFEWLVPLNSSISGDLLLDLVYAMLLTSIGSAMIFNVAASAGGTDIVALILKKHTGINVGKALFFSDSVVAFSSFVVFGVKIGLYSVLGLFTKSFMVDAVIENLNSCKYFLVITTKGGEISDFVMKQLHHGVTVNAAEGEYTHTEKAMIHTVCRRSEAIRLRNFIREIDPHAFMIITTSSEIIGRGFRGL